MIVGGYVNGNWTDNVELVSLDESPVPDCLTSLNSYSYGTLLRGAGAALALGMA